MQKLKLLYILPFDHRASFLKIFGLTPEALTPAQVAMVADYKHVVYEGLLRALELGVPQECAAVLVDEQFGALIHREARAAGIMRILTTEKSGQDEFDFEYGADFGAHIDALKPDYVKVLVRYNSRGDAVLNARQRAKLKIMNDFCRANGYQFLFELLVPATAEQLAACAGDIERFEKSMRALLTKEAIREMHDGGIEPNIWKIEGLDDAHQMRVVTEETRLGGRNDVGVVVLGRGESDEKVRRWLGVAATIPGVTGFAVGRTVFKQPLTDYFAGKIDRLGAVEIIANNYKSFVDLFLVGQ